MSCYNLYNVCIVFQRKQNKFCIMLCGNQLVKLNTYIRIYVLNAYVYVYVRICIRIYVLNAMITSNFRYL